MITIKSDSQIAYMRRANLIVRDTLDLLREHTKPGVSTLELDKLAYEYILSQNAKPSFLHYNGFPAYACRWIAKWYTVFRPHARSCAKGR